MKSETFCQSCSMPLDGQELWGTEADGSKNPEYCKYCYQNGKFTNPGLTLEEMQKRVTEKMDDQNIPEDILEAAISRLPSLKRWKNAVQHITDNQ